MWRIFDSLGLYSPGEYTTMSEMHPDAVLPLDEITVAGNAIGWLSNIDDIIKETFDSNVQKHRKTSAKYAGHMENLVEWRVLKDITNDRRRMANRRFISTYFAIPKDLLLARSIFNDLQLFPILPLAASCKPSGGGGDHHTIEPTYPARKRPTPFPRFHRRHTPLVSSIASRGRCIEKLRSCTGTIVLRMGHASMGWSHSPYAVKASRGRCSCTAILSSHLMLMEWLKRAPSCGEPSSFLSM